MSRNFLAITALALASLTAVAQSTTTPATTPAPTAKSIHQRKVNQQDRIAQGVKSGQLTPKETAHLENKEAGLNKEEKAMRQENGGKLTQADKNLLNKQQNKLSKDIYKDKHNDRTTK